MTTDAARAKSAISIVRLIGETLRLERDGKLFVGLCPFHGERTPSFYVYPDHCHCFGCGAHGDAIDWLQHAHRMSFVDAVAYLGGDNRQCLDHVPGAGKMLAPTERLGDETLERERNLELARRLWLETLDPRGTIVERYLEHRGGLRLPDAPVTRFHPACPRKRPEPPLPAMVSLMVDPVSGQPCGIHRTFLRPDGAGKADIPKAKMMLGQAGVVRLVDLEEVGEGLGVAEGLETAMTVTQRIG